LQPNPHYNWSFTGFKLVEVGWTGYLLNLTSGAWLTPADSNRYIWTHQLLVVVPTNVTTDFLDSAALWITGGDNNNPGNPSAYDEDVLVCASLATSTGTVCSVVYQCPNQPVVFSADPEKKERSEDAAVAFTWVQYMIYHPTQADWIIYFPMVRGATTAMDAVSALFFDSALGGHDVLHPL
jgi:PhoPQ-activated pathogenicity-related protein